MQRQLTWVLLTAAVALFAVIWFVERRLPGTAERRAPQRILPVANANAINTLAVSLPNGGTVRAEREGERWVLTQPPYPARQVAVETFLTNLVQLRAIDRIAERDVTLQGAKSFGLEPARAIVEVEFESNLFKFSVGGLAPLTSNLYLRLGQSGEVVLADAGLLGALPRTTNDWRDPSLLQLTGRFDHVQIRAGQRSFELARVATNNAWQISKPLPARADQDRVLELLRVLRNAEATEFVTDSPGADLERFGLQTPEVEVSFSSGTNRLHGIEFGNSPTNRPDQVFGRLLGNTNIVLAPRELVGLLAQPYKTFHDPRLIVINPAALDRLGVHSLQTFTLQKQPGASWAIDDKQKTPVDRELLHRLAARVGSLQILDIAKEVPADADLKAYGFIPPTASYSFFQQFTNAAGIPTNILFTELLFGVARADKVYVRRSDESPVYLTELATMLSLPKRAFELRDRTIWRFDPTNVVSITLRDVASTNSLVRSATGWSADQIINAAAEELVYRLSQLNAQEWVDKGVARLATFGFDDSSFSLEVNLRGTAETNRLSVRFGRRTLGKDIYAAQVLPGDTEPTIFEFAGDLYMMILQAFLSVK